MAMQALVRRGRFLTTTFLLEVGHDRLADLDLRGQDRVGDAGAVRDAVVSPLRCARPKRNGRNSGAAGRRPARNDLMALIKRRVLKAEGNLQIFMANLRYFKEALAKLRAAGAAA